MTRIWLVTLLVLPTLVWAQTPAPSPELVKCQQDADLLRATIFVLRQEQAARQERDAQAVLDNVRRQQQAAPVENSKTK